MPDYLKDLISKTKKLKEEDASNPSSPPAAPSVTSKSVESVVPKKTSSLDIPPASSNAPKEPSFDVKFTPSAPVVRKATELFDNPADAPDVPEKSLTEKKMDEKPKTEIAAYGDTKIYRIEGEPLLYYYTPVPRPTMGEKNIINTIKEAATRLITIAPYKVRDAQERRNVYYQRIMDILKSAPELNIPAHRFDFYANAVVREMVGYGLIDSLVRDDQLEEIMVIGPKTPVYVFHRKYEMMVTNIEFFSDMEVQDLVNRIGREVGRRIDISSPLLDARLPDGSRVNATIPPATVSGSTLTIRKFKKDPYTLIDLINYKTLSIPAAAFLWLCAEGLSTSPANILIAGGTGSGKTTLLNVLSSMVPARERIISIEDTAELSLPLLHWIRMEARPPGLEGKGELTMDILTKNSLRMRPDRIIVGEIRHDEAFTLFTAMNTGHQGSMGTVHANSAQETIVRVTNPPMNVPQVMLSGLDFVVIENRLHDRQKGTIRRVTEISELTGVLEGKAQTQTIFEYDPSDDTVKRTDVPSQYLAKLMRLTGQSKKKIDEELAAREAFLTKLVQNNIRSMNDFASATTQYLESQK